MIPSHADTTHMRPLDRASATPHDGSGRPLDVWPDGHAPVYRRTTGPRNDVKHSSLQLSTFEPMERGCIVEDPMRLTPQPGDSQKPYRDTHAAHTYRAQFSSVGTAHVTDGPTYSQGHEPDPASWSEVTGAAGQTRRVAARNEASFGEPVWPSDQGHVPHLSAATRLSDEGMRQHHGHFEAGQQNANPSGRLTPTGGADRVLDVGHVHPSRRIGGGPQEAGVSIPPEYPATHQMSPGAPNGSRPAGGPPSTPGSFGGRGSRAAEHIYHEGALRRSSHEEHLPATSYPQEALGSPQGRDFHSSLQGAAPMEKGMALPSAPAARPHDTSAAPSTPSARAWDTDPHGAHSVHATARAGMQTPSNIDTAWSPTSRASAANHAASLSARASSPERPRSSFTEPMADGSMPPLINGPGPAVATTPGRRRDQRDFDGGGARNLISGGQSWGASTPTTAAPGSWWS